MSGRQVEVPGLAQRVDRAVELTASRGRAIWFGTARCELFGFYHPPASLDVRQQLGIVICKPFGNEATSSERPLRLLAQRLAARGFPVLRLDYHGTGNSSGNDRDPGRWEAWQHSVRVAIDELRRQSRCEQVGLVGLRLGANLALSAIEWRRDVASVALWSPVLHGRAFLREELACQRLRTRREQLHARPREGEIESLGFVLSAQTEAALREHSLAKLRAAPFDRALVLSRECALQESLVADQLRSLGVVVSEALGPGYAEMLRDNQLPSAAWDLIVEHFESKAGARLVRPARSEALAARPASMRSLPTRAARAGWRGRGPRSEAWVWDALGGDAAVRESAGYFGAGRRLFGVVTHGCTGIALDRPAAVVFLSGGHVHHIGHNRMYVRWARQWARHGVTSLRLDVSGLGDSFAAPGQAEGELHGPHGVEDVREALEYLAQHGCSRFAIVGLCSGAFLAFHTALADSRVARLGLINWLRFYPPTSLDERPSDAPENRRYRSIHHYLTAAVRGDAWLRLSRGEIDVAGIARTLAARAWRQFSASLSPVWQRPTPGAPRLPRDMRQLAERGVRSLLLYDGGDPAIDDLREQLGPALRELRSSGRLGLEIIDGADHTLSPGWAQERVGQLLHAWLVGPARV